MVISGGKWGSSVRRLKRIRETNGKWRFMLAKHPPVMMRFSKKRTRFPLKQTQGIIKETKTHGTESREQPPDDVKGKIISPTSIINKLSQWQAPQPSAL